MIAELFHGDTRLIYSYRVNRGYVLRKLHLEDYLMMVTMVRILSHR